MNRSVNGLLTAYVLLIKNGIDKKISIGSLGLREFKRGRYLYIGSAKKNLGARIAWHMSKDKRVFWHIDYFLKGRGVSVEKVWLTNLTECRLARIASSCGRVIVGFGSSDCGCPSHLFYIGR